MTLHRFFLPADAVGQETVTFPQEQAHQIRKVLRLRPDDRVIVLRGDGNELEVRLTQVGGEVVGTIEERRPNGAEPAHCLVLYQGLVKGAKFETVLQKGTELGLSGFVPVVTGRSVPAEPGPARLRRFEAIVREAAEQSRRGRLPDVAEPIDFAAALDRATRDGPLILLWEDEQSTNLRDLCSSRVFETTSTVSLFVGPEGGFTTEEVEQARAAGACVATLGPRILRAETAAIVGSALVLHLLNDLG